MRARRDPAARAPVRARGSVRIGRRIALAAALCSALAAGVTAWAYWSASVGAGSVGAAVAASVNQGATPTAVAGAGRTVTVEWGTSTLSNGHAVDGYVVKRYDAGTAALQTTLAGCAGTVTATSCVESGVPAGAWEYSVTPVFATNWEGPEGLKSGTATVAAATLSLDETLFGPPLPQSTTGSLAGFAAMEGIGYRLDAGTPLTGSPSSASASGTATITSLSIPGTSDGAHTVYALGDASPSPSVASAGIVVDTTVPTVAAELTPAPNAAGWNSVTPVQVTLSADDAGGSGIDRLRYTTDGSDPLTSGTALDYASPLSISAASTTVRYFAADLAGNASAVQTQLVRIDLTAPVNLLSLSGVSGGAHLAGTTVFYRGTEAGSFTLTNAVSDPGGSGAVSSATAALSGTSTGWSHAASVVALPSGGPYVSGTFGWSAGTASAPGAGVTGTDAAGNTTTTDLTFIPDGAGPTGGAVSVNGVAATGSGSVSGSVSGGFAIVRTDYDDAGSGLLSSVLTLESAALSSSDGVVAGACAAFGSPSVVSGSPAQSVSGPACYRYTLTGTDRVGNTSALVTVVTVDASAPSAPVLSLSGATGNAYVSGATVFVNPQAGSAGGFEVAATTTDAQSGIAKVTFPALTGFASGGGDDSASPYETTYGWSGAVAATGSQTVTATNVATGTATSTFTVTPDSAGPTGGALSVNGVAATGGGSVSGSVSGGFAIVRTDYDDAGSGLLSSVLTVESAALSSSDGVVAGACAAFGSPSVVSGSPAQSVSGPACYRYTLTGTDRVGNTSALVTVVTVDASAPSAPVLSLSGATGNAYVSGATVFVNPQAGSAGGFEVAATTTDAQSGIAKVTFPALTGFASGGGDDGAAPFATTYGWSGAVAATGSQTVTATNVATGTATNTFTVTPDSTGPTGGALSVNGVAATGAGSVSVSPTGSFAIGTRTDYSLDAASGFASSQLTVQTAALSSADGIAAGTCSTFAAGSVLAGQPAQTVSGPSCYRYTLTGTDRVGNTSAVSTIVKVDTTAPSAPALTLSGATGTKTYISGTTVYVNAQGANTGTFQVAATTSDADSGIQKVAFPLLTGFNNGGGGGDVTSSPYQTTYSWTGAVGASTNTVTATNTTGKTATGSFTVTPDTTGPTLTAVTSKQSNGSAGNGMLETGDQLVLTFSEGLRASTVPATFTGTEKRAATFLQSLPNVKLAIPNIFSGTSIDTGDSDYLAGGVLCGLTCTAATANFSGSVALVQAGSATTITLTVSSVTGDATEVGQGAITFVPAPGLLDQVGNGATATLPLGSTFRLF